ncbi:hypothetical protein Y88_3006 [Novosphingobium nitrogenifigens DSM 19370]|uniref:Nudix hydrolase domain-containing protein n=1 Tax=Novosphingobium nitrogenifigens DSM 19370 TaxID=983920 RepID=F1ZCB3_9SPHN|nr:DUF47 family protein [Novosphingobium nitrogenifigens]EGD57680.1 hypothetical protein Y88_3006 [Novosphingobium nitrogenifigens DSM 19370]
MLVTSRGTGRWVLPKGNGSKGEQPHAAAAREALEEAGVTGAICPTPIGSYQYRKTLRSGAAVKANVLVFPLAVTSELDGWQEAGERTRRWFSLAEAAQMVDEPDLAVMIRCFRTTDLSAHTEATPLVRSIGSVKEKMGMFHWFQNLLPRQGNFFELFEAHGQTIVAGSSALARLLQGGSGMADHVREIIERENDADAITREVLVTVRKTFLTPFDRGAITSLIGSMDDAIDQMYQTANAVSIYEVTAFEPEMQDMAAIIVEAARLIAEALPLLRTIHGNAARLHELTERLIRLEGRADEIYHVGLTKAFKTHGESAPMRFFVAREIYIHLERVVDKFEDVANEIDNLVIDHA